MNYYPHHIGDFRSGTVHMTRQERWIYRDLLDVYYDKEQPLPLDLAQVCNEVGVRTEEERALVAGLLQYKFIETPEGWRHERCDAEIVKYHAKAEKAKVNGKLGGRPPKQSKPEPEITQSVSLANPDLTGSEANQEPITNNHKPRTKAKSIGAALPDFIPAESWKGFEEMRKSKGKPLTERAKQMIYKTLERLQDGGHNITEILDRSTVNAWSNVYEPKPEHIKRVTNGYESAKDRSRREAAEKLTGRSRNVEQDFIDIN